MEYELGTSVAQGGDAVLRGRAFEDRRGSGGATALTLLGNEGQSSSLLLLSFVEARRSSITGQISVKMSLDAIRESVEVEGEIDAPSLVRARVKEANTRLYRYGAKMLSGAKIAARGVVVAFDGYAVTAARAGNYESVLVRDGAVIPLFERVSSGRSKERDQDRGEEGLLGAEPTISVDLTTVAVEEGDLFLFTSVSEQEAKFPAGFPEGVGEKTADMLAQQVAQQQAGDDIAVVHHHTFVAVLRIEPSSIVLDEVVDD